MNDQKVIQDTFCSTETDRRISRMSTSIQLLFLKLHILKGQKGWTNCHNGAHHIHQRDEIQFLSAFLVINIFKYFSSCSHCIQDLAHRVGWRSTCIRNICKNWKNSCHLKVALWRFAPDFGLLQNSHTGKIYTKQYCIFIESDLSALFTLLALFTGPYHLHWALVVTCKSVIWHNWGTALQGYITSQGWSGWPGILVQDAQDLREDEQDEDGHPDLDPDPDGHPDHWDNKLTLEAQTLHIAKRTRT